MKGEGNEYFKKGDYSKAASVYSRVSYFIDCQAIRYLSLSPKDDNELEIVLHLNLAACYNKDEFWEGSIAECQKVIILLIFRSWKSNQTIQKPCSEWHKHSVA